MLILKLTGNSPTLPSSAFNVVLKDDAGRTKDTPTEVPGRTCVARRFSSFPWGATGLSGFLFSAANLALCAAHSSPHPGPLCCAKL
ncbi:hypothetical protein CYMTET_46260 [Cymbomonas tetramitiformis]|uniref:Uncharacterized protein n=1 Tax=Cymbomonas tetramitiformis TaxID=36881 RepID=A0AAE0EXS7_9CHLO|nr:hypothetical protein CYMTET_46260 [Cymbomonas tetramitiformis]